MWLKETRHVEAVAWGLCNRRLLMVLLMKVLKRGRKWVGRKTQCVEESVLACRVVGQVPKILRCLYIYFISESHGHFSFSVIVSSTNWCQYSIIINIHHCFSLLHIYKVLWLFGVSLIISLYHYYHHHHHHLLIIIQYLM